MLSRKIFIAAVVAYAIGLLFSPPDMISQMTSGVMTAMLCLIPLLILARRTFFKNASKPMHTLVCILICMVSVLSMFCHMLVVKIAHDAKRSQDTAVVTSRP